MTAPSGNLELLLWLESDRIATLADALTKDKLDNQRDVVKNERRQGLENVPYGRWFPLLFEGIFPSDHPYSWPVIGSHEDLTAATLEDVTDFFRQYYTPNNLSLVIAGDFDPAEAKRLVGKYLGPIPPGPPLDRPRRYIPTLDREKVIDAMDRVPQERVYLAWPSPPLYAPDDAALDVTGTILSDGLSSRLQKALIYDKPLASDVEAFQYSLEISGVFVVQATARPGVSLDDIQRIVGNEIARLAKLGPTAQELSRAKTKREYNFITGLERIGGFGGKADLLNQYNTYLGDPAKFEWDIQRYRDIDAAAVRAAAGRWLDTDKRLAIRFHPETSSPQEGAAALDRSKKPETGPDRPFKTPDVQTAKLENGLQIFVVERHDLPKIALTLATRAGGLADPAGKEGVANLVMRTIRSRNQDANRDPDRRRARRSRNRALWRRGARDVAAWPGCPEDESRCGDGHHGRRRAAPDLSAKRVRPRASAPARHAVTTIQRRKRARRPRSSDARLRRRTSLRPPGLGTAVDGQLHHAR